LPLAPFASARVAIERDIPMTTLTFQSIANSNLPVAEKTQMMRAYERITGKDMPTAIAQKFHMLKGAGLETLETVRAYGEGGIAGAALGLAHSQYGLDQKYRGHVVPVDLVASGAAALGAIGLAAMGNPLATEARNIGTGCVSVFSFRKIQDLRKSMGSKVHGDDIDSYGDIEGDDDPIISKARSL